MMRKIFLCALAAILLTGVVAYAHHSYAATYDVGKEVKLQGKLIQFIFRNPHSYVTIQAPDSKGVMQRWAVEWAGTSQLSARGISQDTLKINDAITLVGRPSRVPGEYRLLMLNLTRPADGFSWGTKAGEIVE
jgi:Family of unknown function (DUF6152)